MGEKIQIVKNGAVIADYILPQWRGRAQEMQEKPSDIPYVLPHLRVLSLSTPSLAPTREAWATRSHISVTEQKHPVGFLDLAGEVRNKIYRYALTARRNNPQKCVWSGLGRHEGQTYFFATGLFRVNRQVYHEASSIFYRENGFVLVREPKDNGDYIPNAGTGRAISSICRRLRRRYNALISLLLRSVPAIAATRKASECNRMAIIYQFGSRDIKSINYLEQQIVLAAKDFELFALIAIEMSLPEALLPDVMYSVQAAEGSCVLSEAARQELLIGLKIFMGLKMALTDDLWWQQLPQGPRFIMYSDIDFQTLSERLEAKVADGSFTSAPIFFEVLEEYWARLVDPNSSKHWGHYALPVIEWKQRHAEALRKAGHDEMAHEVVKSAISMWQEHGIPGITQVLQSEICCLRARLDEIEGSLSRMRDAVFWFGEALRYDLSNTALNNDIKRVEQEIFVLDGSNW